MEAEAIKGFFEQQREAVYTCRKILGFGCFTETAEAEIEAFEILEELSKGIDTIEDLYQILLDESVTDETVLKKYGELRETVEIWRRIQKLD